MSETEIVRISFCEGESQGVGVTRLAPNVYRLEWTPLIFSPTAEEEENLELYLGDTIETRQESDGTIRFLRVHERAQLRHGSWLVPEQFVNSRQFPEFGAAVAAEGGAWEVLMGGWLLVHLPLASGFDVEAELDRCIRAALEGYA